MRVFALILVTSLVPYVCGSQLDRKANFTNEDRSKLSQFIEELMRCRRIPGLSLSVVGPGEDHVSRGFGLADVEASSPAGANTQFCVASLTKAFTVTLLGKILKRFGHTWDTPLVDILGSEYSFLDDVLSGRGMEQGSAPDSERVTVRDLLLHKTGIPRYDYLWIAGVYSRDELLRHIKCMKRTEKFRSKAMYNNIMYSLAGKVVETLTNKTYEESLKGEILEPLGMTSSNFRHEQVPSGVNRASQYGFLYVNGPLIKLTDTKYKGAESIAPAISLCTTAEDMSKWIRYNLDGGVTHSDVLDPDTLREIQEGQVPAAHMFPGRVKPPLAGVTYGFDRYGLGWFVGEYRGLRALMHYGSFPGFYSLITIIPEIHFGLFTSINGGEQDYPWTLNSLIHTVAIDLALDHQPWIGTQAACVFPPGSLEEMGSDPFVVDTSFKSKRHLKEYIGVYFHPVFNNVTFGLVNDTLMQMRFGDVLFNAIPNSDKDAFTLVVVDKTWYIGPATVTFTLDTENNDNSMDSVEIPFFEPKAPPVFKRPPENVDIVKWRHLADEECDISGSRDSTYRFVSSSGNSFGNFVAALIVFVMGVIMII